MASIEVLGSIPLADNFLHEPKKNKKKKGKKTKREKLDKPKSKPEVQPRLKNCSDICDPNLFVQWPEIKKKKRKKKPDVSLNEEFPLTQNKNLKPSKRLKKNRKSKCHLDTHAVEHSVRSGPVEQILEPQPILSSTRKEKKPKKRVAFNLTPALLEPKPPQYPFGVRDPVQTQCSGKEEKTTAEETGMESQSTSDDVNSQDLFITQKSFSDPYIDLCCSTSAEESVESQGYTETRPETYTAFCQEPRTASSGRSSPKPQSDTAPCPAHQSYTASYPEPRTCTASSGRKRSSPKPQADTSYPEHQSYTASYPEHQSLPKKSSCPAYHPSPPRNPSQHHKLDTSTQTENFFTSPPFATSLRFLYRNTCTDAPIDLSLPKRSRLPPLDVVSKASEDLRRPEPNTTDLTQSDDSDSHSKSKADPFQLKVVQTRLNESFFFKLKGEGDSPKPRSPLMKLAGSFEKNKP